MCVCVCRSYRDHRPDEPSTLLSPAHPKLFHTPHPAHVHNIPQCDSGYQWIHQLRIASRRFLQRFCQWRRPSDKSTRGRGLEKEVMRLEVTSDKARHMQHLTRSSKALGDVFAGLGNYLICVSQKGETEVNVHSVH